ncbi:MAG TPA: glycosyltransferase family 39 protein [Thermoanaerobaculia bacterium]|nr:glycosyltransferase family 39 protein [Thermoanaerobaculia bacterium]
MPARASRVALLVIVIIAAVRVGSTWRVVSQTYDEAAHIATGAEWIERGTYLGEPQHPPLARVATAIGPYLAGGRLAGMDIGLIELGNEILHSGSHLRLLTAARAGILPFFLLSIVIVWAHARMLGGELAGVLAALLYSSLPPVLAHAGLATTDMAVTCGIAAALMFLQRWLLAPTRINALLLGLATAVAVTSKFSSVLFLSVAGLAILIVTRPKRFTYAWMAIVMCIVAVWGVYRFNFEQAEKTHYHLLSAWIEQHPRAEFLRPVLDDVPIPMPALFSGVAQMLLHNASGHEAYLLGEFSKTGWWYYFPIAIAVKTPIAFLLIALASPFLVPRRNAIAPLLAALMIVVACLPVKINIGIRHVLPIYPLLAVTAGCALAMLWPKRRAIVIAVLAIEIIVSARAHPDYIPYFNVFAGKEPQRILLDSNLDWGQDLLRLEAKTRELKIEALRLSYFGTADLTRFDLPPLLPVVHDRAAPGWFAVSESNLRSREHGHNFPWTERYPYQRIGKTIRLYHVPGPVPRAERNEVLKAMARIVVPLPLGSSGGSDGRVWTTRLRLRNQTDRRQLVLDRLGNRRELPPRGTLVWDAPTERSAFFVYVRKAAIVDGEVEVSASKNGQLIERPFLVDTPKAELFRSIAILRTTTGCDGCKRTLRVYSLSAGPVALDIAARAGDKRWSHYKVLGNDPGLPAWSEFDVATLFPELGNEPAEVTVVAYKHEPVWAMMTTSGARREIVTSSQ